MAIDYCASAREIQRMFPVVASKAYICPELETRIHHSVCYADGSPVNGARRRVLPSAKDLPRSDVKSAPGSPRNLLSEGTKV